MICLVIVIIRRVVRTMTIWPGHRGHRCTRTLRSKRDPFITEEFEIALNGRETTYGGAAGVYAEFVKIKLYFSARARGRQPIIGRNRIKTIVAISL